MPLSVAFAILIVGPWLMSRGALTLKLPGILGMPLFGVGYAALAGGSRLSDSGSSAGASVLSSRYSQTDG